MIIDHGARLVIATPTKCGKTTLEAMCRRQARRHDELLEVVRPGQHRLDVPEQATGYKRFMMIRNPWSRLVSTWSFLANPISKGEQNARAIQGMSFLDFVEWWINERDNNLCDWTEEPPNVVWSAPARWLMTLTECDEVWCAEGFIRLEYLVEDLVKIARVDYGPEVFNNSSRKVRPGMWTDYYDHDLYMRVATEFAGAEAVKFGYKPTFDPRSLTGKYMSQRLDSLKPDVEAQAQEAIA